MSTANTNIAVSSEVYISVVYVRISMGFYAAPIANRFDVYDLHQRRLYQTVGYKTSLSDGIELPTETSSSWAIMPEVSSRC